MDKRLELHSKLLMYSDNVYFQPPSNIKMKYPCIVYHKSGKSRRFGNDRLYFEKQNYNVTVMDLDPDSQTADDMEKDFNYCTINQNFVVDNINHTVLSLYY